MQQALGNDSGRCGETVTVWPAPAGEALSTDFLVTVDGKTSPVYVARVPPQDKAQRNAASGYAEAAFTTFDMAGPVTVSVTCPAAITSARVLPSVAEDRADDSGQTGHADILEPKP